MEGKISRRTVICLSSTSLASSLSGCNTLIGQDEPERFTLCRLEIFNRDQDTEHTIEIHVQADGETVHRGTYDIPSATGSTVSDKEFDPHDWLDGTIQTLTVEGRVDEQDRVGPREITASQVSEQTEVIYKIAEDESLEISTLVAGNACDRNEP